MTETEFQAWIMKQARARNIVCFHVPDSRGMTAGLPDLILVGAALVFAEIKSEKGILRPAQRDIHNRLQSAGCPCYIWAPGDDFAVLAVLNALAVVEA